MSRRDALEVDVMILRRTTGIAVLTLLTAVGATVHARPFGHGSMAAPPARDGGKWGESAQSPSGPGNSDRSPSSSIRSRDPDSWTRSRPTRPEAQPRDAASSAESERHTSIFSRRRSLRPEHQTNVKGTNRPSWTRPRDEHQPMLKTPNPRDIDPLTAPPQEGGMYGSANGNDDLWRANQRHEQELTRLETKLADAEQDGNTRKVKAVNWLMTQENARHQKEMMKLERQESAPRLHAGPAARSTSRNSPSGFSFHPLAGENGRLDDSQLGARPRGQLADDRGMDMDDDGWDRGRSPLDRAPEREMPGSDSGYRQAVSNPLVEWERRQDPIPADRTPPPRRMASVPHDREVIPSPVRSRESEPDRKSQSVRRW